MNGAGGCDAVVLLTREKPLLRLDSALPSNQLVESVLAWEQH